MIRVIIADDEKLICRLVQALADWDSLGMEVAGTAENGLEALQLVEALEPDILITDIRMPGCDGLELIRRAKELRPQLEVVIISGYAHFEYAQSAIQFGVGNYLLKPIKKEELMDTLRKMKERCEARFDKEEGDGAAPSEQPEGSETPPQQPCKRPVVAQSPGIDGGNPSRYIPFSDTGRRLSGFSAENRL